MNLKRNIKGIRFDSGCNGSISVNRSGDVGWRVAFGAGILMVALISGLLGCGAFRDLNKEKRIIRTSSDSSLTYMALEKQGSREVREAVVLRRDSSEADYTLEVWPRGKFSYSPEMGFEGEALKVIISGSQKKTSEMVERQLVQEASSRVYDQRLQSQHNSKGVEKTGQVRKTVGWKMIAGFLALGCTLIVIAFGWLLKHRLAVSK
jgi:hypothetical protein